MNNLSLITRRNLMRSLSFIPALACLLPGQSDAVELPEPPSINRYIAIDNVCAWPNLTLLPRRYDCRDYS